MSVEVRGHRESAAVDTRQVLLLVGSFLAASALAWVGLHFYFDHVLEPQSLERPLQTFPIPDLQPSPTRDYLDFRKRQNEQLSGTAWVDGSRSLVHLPIEDAKALVLSRGANAFGPAPGEASPAEVARTGQPPDGAPRAVPTLRSHPYGASP